MRRKRGEKPAAGDTGGERGGRYLNDRKTTTIRRELRDEQQAKTERESVVSRRDLTICLFLLPLSLPARSVWVSLCVDVNQLGASKLHLIVFISTFNNVKQRGEMKEKKTGQFFRRLQFLRR